jgi:predicted MFS family arabinose efflux permease
MWAHPVWSSAPLFFALRRPTPLLPAVGRLSDRRGVARPIGVGLLVSAVFLAVLALPSSVWALAITSIIALGGLLTIWMIPTASLITLAADAAGCALAIATMIIELAWAAGETIGAPAAAGLAGATGDVVPFLVLAALMLSALLVVLKRARRVAADSSPQEARFPQMLGGASR